MPTRHEDFLSLDAHTYELETSILVICDGVGSFVYRDRRSGYVGRWDDHALHACEIAEDPQQQAWIAAEAERSTMNQRAIA